MNNLIIQKIKKSVSSRPDLLIANPLVGASLIRIYLVII